MPHIAAEAAQTGYATFAAQIARDSNLDPRFAALFAPKPKGPSADLVRMRAAVDGWIAQANAATGERRRRLFQQAEDRIEAQLIALDHEAARGRTAPHMDGITVTDLEEARRRLQAAQAEAPQARAA